MNRTDITDEVGDWKSYKAKHIFAIKGIIQKIGNGKTYYQELQHTKFTPYIDRCKRYVNNTGGEKMSKLVNDFDKEILDKLYEERSNKIKSNWN